MSTACDGDSTTRVLVCGLSGAGKSSFINVAAGSELLVGHHGESTTLEITDEGIPAVHIDDVHVQLVDTPGFDSTHDTTDTEMFLKLVAWLNTRTNERITGIVYLRPINVPRVNKLEASFIQMFKALCGEQQLDHVILVTNRWSSPAEAVSEELERRLASDVKYLGTGGGQRVQTARLTNRYTKQDVLRVLSLLHGLSPITLLSQQETINEHKPPMETTAGAQLEGYTNSSAIHLKEMTSAANECTSIALEGIKIAEETRKRAENRIPGIGTGIEEIRIQWLSEAGRKAWELHAPSKKKGHKTKAAVAPTANRMTRERNKFARMVEGGYKYILEFATVFAVLAAILAIVILKSTVFGNLATSK